ncbi:MAG: HipA domain-containing protein [Lachnospiraceae bacterium]|nr:HipA domain-containing protein [Lachnospiraceae bacterium]
MHIYEYYDFDKCKQNTRSYGGKAGDKTGIILDGENWLLKFPKSTKSFRDVMLSYSTAPLSEFLGSNIYKSIGLDVQETLLGEFRGKTVVACKDFLQNGDSLDEFMDIINQPSESISDETKERLLDDSKNEINDIITVIENNHILKNVNAVKERFWDMFVVDAFIGNNDRNNGNWGIIRHLDDTLSLAPVYDNGNAFSNKSDDSRMKKILNNDDLFLNSAYHSATCCFMEDGKSINPLKYILSGNNSDCNEAIKRIVPRIDMSKIEDIISSAPTITEIQMAFYLELVTYRKEEVLDKALLRTIEYVPKLGTTEKQKVPKM